MKSVMNKRRAPRKDCRVPVESKEGTAFDFSQTIDISEGGVGFVSSRYIPANTKMFIEIALTPQGDPVLAVAHVQWVSRIPGSKNFRVGMKFDDIMSGSKSRISRVKGLH